ncbi:indolethylamine N-methyltransferase-like [Pelodytes ibericus]
MNPSSLKHYHEHSVDSQFMFDTYFSSSADQQCIEEVLMFPINEFHKEAKSGRLKGDTLIDFSTGPNIIHLLPICKLFKDVIILEFNDQSLMDIQKWVNNEEGAFDWSHVSQLASELEGDRDNWKEKEEDLRRRIKRILKCDFTKENPTHPDVLQKADCVCNFYVLGHISKDLDEYCHNLKITSSMLKLGGRLLLTGGFNATFYMLGEHKYHILCFKEEEFRKAVRDCGFCIERLEVMDSKIQTDAFYFEKLFFIIAVKEREP